MSIIHVAARKGPDAEEYSDWWLMHLDLELRLCLCSFQHRLHLCRFHDIARDL